MLSSGESEVISPQARQALTPTWVVFGLAMGPAVALGLARFAYGLLLPAMRADLGWNFTEAGAMNTANAIGYLLGAAVTAPLSGRMENRRLFAVSLLWSVVTIAASGLTGGYSLLLALRFAAGFTGALAFISGAALTSAAATGGSDTRAPTLLGIYFSGGGIGIIASAVTIPRLLETMGWRAAWLALGGLGVAAAAFACSALRRSPEPSRAAPDATGGGWSPRFMGRYLLAYSLFGAGYFGYATFIIAYLRATEGFSGVAISVFWSILGLASVAAVFFWGPILARLKGGRGAATPITVVMIGAAMPLLWREPAGAYLSAILFGGSFLSVVAAMMAFVRRTAKPHAWTAAIATLTVAFGLGQCVGPLLSGALSDGPNGLRSGLWLAVGLLAAGSIIALLQGEPARVAAEG